MRLFSIGFNPLDFGSNGPIPPFIYFMSLSLIQFGTVVG